MYRDYMNIKRVTIRDVAKVAGVSHATVSRALHDHKEINIATRIKIQQIAKEMNYIPDLAARNLATHTADSVGVIIPDIGNSFFTKIIAGIEDYCNGSNRYVILGQSRYDLERELKIVKGVLQRRVEGVIICPSSTENMTKIQELCVGVPLVFLCADASSINASFMAVDDVQAGKTATEYLLGLGHRKINFFGLTKSNNSVKRRVQGYFDALQSFGLEADESRVNHCGMDYQAGHAMAVELISRGDVPDAILAGNDLIAVGAMAGLNDAGYRVPEDVAVMGFDDIDMAGLPQVALTTMAQPRYEMGKIAAEMLLQGKQRYGDTAQGHMVEASLKIRNSCRHVEK